jgi:hypothetical protein
VQQTINDVTDCIKIECNPDISIFDLKYMYMNERVKARKIKAKEIFYKRAEREGKLETIKALEEKQKETLGDSWVDLTTVSIVFGILFKFV